MIELGKILIKDQTSIIEARNKIGLLAEDLKFNSFDTTRLATITSELARIIYQEDEESSMVVGFDEKKGTFGLLLIFQGKKEKLDVEKAKIFFDKLDTFRTKEGFQRVEAFKYIPDPEFEPTKEFIDAETEKLLRLSRAELLEEVKRKYEELKEMQEKLVHSEKLAALGKLAGIVGHELRNPLGAIRNSVYFLRLKLGPALQDEKIKRHLEMLDQEISNSDRIISDILFFSRVKPPIFTQNNLNAILKASLKKVMINPNIKVETELAELPLIPSDEGQMVQVFFNIILNAAESMPEGGKLTISSSVKQDRDFIKVSIKDTGEGISKENLSKLFEPLFSTKIKGTGLGMVACKSIIENHKGYIRVESEKGKGTLVMVELPIKQT